MNHRAKFLSVSTVLFVSVGVVRLTASDPIPLQDSKKSPAPHKVQVITNSIGMKLARIPLGKFTMGSPEGEAEREAKEIAHEVSITKPFYMGVFEVTQAEFASVVGGEEFRFFNKKNGGGREHPIDNVRWKETELFCQKLSALSEERRNGRKYRLPTEAEWEYACRAGTKTTFHFGDSLSSSQANFNGGYPYGDGKKGPYLRRTSKVGSYKPNAFGLHDMHGNVWEWCVDWYDPKYYGKSPAKDPGGPSDGVTSDDYANFYRVIRGGSWLDDARGCRSAYRYRAMHRNRYRMIGFRVVCEIAEKKPETK
jgi:formylglycine-generating enzyme required for sulfatase activity